MADATVKHFIFSRFFTFNDPKYPHDIYDVDFLSTQLPLAKNMLSSLENQTNKNFDLVFLVNEKFFDNPTYEFVFKTLQDSTTLSLTFIRKYHPHRLVEDAYTKYDFVIQSRMDFDDFIYKDAVADTQSKIHECDKILAYGYCKGYMYLNKELFHFDTGTRWGNEGHHSILQSLIVKSSFAKKIPFFEPYYFNHTKIKLNIKGFLEKNGVEFSESMFQRNTSTNAYVYFRHDFSHMSLTNHAGDLNFEIKKYSNQKLNHKDITKKQLKDEFGFNLELNSIE